MVLIYESVENCTEICFLFFFLQKLKNSIVSPLDDPNEILHLYLYNGGPEKKENFDAI